MTAWRPSSAAPTPASRSSGATATPSRSPTPPPTSSPTPRPGTGPTPARALPEAFRVLRPGGALALWWNLEAEDVPWIAEQTDRVRRYYGDAGVAAWGSRGAPGPRTSALPAFTAALDAATAGGPTPHCVRKLVRWSRRVPVDIHLANLGSHSIFLVHGPDRSAAFLAEERDHLLRRFPDGVVEEVYDVEILVTTTVS
ncbi:hypothetical protein SGLAM104S_00733 [Streptomyces glaucescens]